MKNYFEVFKLSPSFHIDQAQLRQIYYQLSRQSHPDHHRQTDDLEVDSAFVNQAYAVLSKPISRIQYLLELLGYAEQNLKPDTELLMEMMELNEEMESLTDAESQIEFKAIYQSRLEHSLKALLTVCQQYDQAPTEEHLNQVKKNYIQYKYLQRLQLPF